MKKLGLTLSFVLVASSVIAQPVVGRGSLFRFDHNTVELAIDAVTAAEFQYDNGAWERIPLPTGFIDAETPNLMTSFRSPVKTTLSLGAHTTRVRLCNIIGCGDASNTVSYTYGNVPGVPTLRLNGVAGGGVVQNRWNFGGLDIIDVKLDNSNIVLNFGSPTWTIPGVFSVQKNDRVELAISR
jgi:hypothetical protein